MTDEIVQYSQRRPMFVIIALIFVVKMAVGDNCQKCGTEATSFLYDD